MNETIDKILPLLSNVKKSGSGYMARCPVPAHKDKHQSLSVKVENGTTLINCLAGCSFKSIIQSLGLNNYEPKEKVIERTYDYLDAEGNLIYQVVRYYPKSFRHRRPDGEGGWVWDIKGVKPFLYNLPKLLAALESETPAVIVEGEKDCETLARYDIVATTCSGGANNWRPEFTEIFHNARVIIIPDNDKAGHEYAYGIASLLYGWAKSLKIINPNVQPGGDVSDFLLDNPIDKLYNLINNASEYIPKGAVTREEFNSLKGQLVYLTKKLNERTDKIWFK